MRKFEQFDSDVYVIEVPKSDDYVVTLVGNEDLTLKTVSQWNNGYFLSKGYEEFAGINFGFFMRDGRDCGLLYTDYGYTNNNQYDTLNGIQAAIMNADGYLVVDDIDLNKMNNEYKGAYFAGDASYSLLKNGIETFDGKAHFPHFNQRHPRTMLGQKRDGTVVLVTVDGRRNSSAGVTGEQQAAIMKDLGCVEAINLDGGGSTTMTGKDGKVLNKPSDGTSRKVCSAIKVYKKKDPTEVKTKLKLDKLAVGAGHCLLTEGKQSIQNPPVKEWSMSSRVVVKLIEKLEQRFEIDILRVDDPTGKSVVTLEERTDKVNAFNPSLYLDLHLNAAKVNQGTGTEVFHSLNDNSKLADKLSKAIADVQGLKDRGAKTREYPGKPDVDYYHTLRESNCMALLLELAFMTTWKDLKVVHDDPKWADKVADVIIEELEEHFEMAPKKEIINYIYVDTLEDNFDRVEFINGAKGTKIYIVKDSKE